MFLNVFTYADVIRLEIVYNRLEFDIPVKPTFKISSKYKPIDL